MVTWVVLPKAAVECEVEALTHFDAVRAGSIRLGIAPERLFAVPVVTERERSTVRRAVERLRTVVEACVDTLGNVGR